MRFFLVFFLLGFSSLYAYETTHLLKPAATFEQLASGSACLTYFDSENSVICNPAIFAFNRPEKLEVSLLGKTGGAGIDLSKDIIFKDITEDTLRKLFEENNFISWTGNGEFSFKNSYFTLSYAPYFILIDALVFNPALPRVSLILMERQYLALSTGIDLTKLLKSEDVAKISIGTRVHYNSDRYFRGSFTLLDLAVNRVDEVITFEKHKGVQSDLGVAFDFESDYIPSLSIAAKNLFSKYEVKQSELEDFFLLQTQTQFETYTQLGLGKQIYTKIGRFDIGLLVNFSELFQRYIDTTTLSLKYSFSLFSIYASTSEYAQTLGLNFKGPSSEIGILYSYERELKNFNLDRDNAIYLNMALNLK